MDYHRTVTDLFNYFYYKLYKDAGYKLDLSVNNQSKQVDNFIKLLAKHNPIESIGVNFLIEYFCFAFEYWSDKTTKRRVSLGWIIGPKTYKRWRERTEHTEFFSRKFTLEYDINLMVLRQELFESETIANGLDPAEELEKMRFDGEARLFNCLTNTTMYNHKSGTCLSCSQHKDCKVLLRQKFPKLFVKRGYK